MAIPKWFNPTFSWGNVGVLLTVVVSFAVTFGSLTSEVKATAEVARQLEYSITATANDLRQTQLVAAVLAETVNQIKETSNQSLLRLDVIINQISFLRESLVAVQTRLDGMP